MTKLTIDIPDGLISKVQSAGHTVESIFVEALTQYVSDELSRQAITKHRTWELCGQYSVAEGIDQTKASREPLLGSTNYAEHVDDVLHSGS